MSAKEPDKPAPSQISDEEIGDLYDGAQEVENSNELNGVQKLPPADPALADIPGISAVNSLLNLTPFTSWIDRRAMTTYKHSTAEGRINKYAQDHKTVVLICIWLELGFRTILVLILIAALILFMLKALLPLPELFAGTN